MRSTILRTFLFVACIALRVSTALAGAEGLEIKPFLGQSEMLDFPIGNGRISVWRCNFNANDIDSVTVSVTLVDNGVCSTLGQSKVPISKPCEGTIYIPWMAHDKSSVMAGPKLLAVGIATDHIQRATSLKPFVLKNGYSLERSLSRNVHGKVNTGDNEMIWIFVFSKTGAKDKSEYKSPFNSLEFSDILETAKGLENASVVIVTVNPQ